jgi:hypothetical protein
MFTILLIFTSCSKEDLEICGEITGGYVQYNSIAQRDYFYFRVNGQEVRVDQKTYESYFVGEFICLQ